MKKILIAFLMFLIMAIPGVASAHVIVTPNQADVGQELTFNVSVPNERNTPVVSIELDLPSGVAEVVPTEKDGWTIRTTTDGSISDPELSSITWTAGNIPVGEREDFSFSAQVPGSATTLDWKAYQTYGDGTVVHWDQTPNGKSDDSVGNSGPYSVTHVVNDLSNTATTSTSNGSTSMATLALVIALSALLVSIGIYLYGPKK
jgi:uncharacterized protein YcnI